MSPAATPANISNALNFTSGSRNSKIPVSASTRGPDRRKDAAKRSLEKDRGIFILDRIRQSGKDVDAVLKKIVGNASAATMLRHSLLWAGKSTRCPNDWFYKTRAEWQEEAGLSESNCKTALKHLRKFSWWKDETRATVWGRALHIRLDVEGILAAVEELLEQGQLRIRLVRDTVAGGSQANALPPGEGSETEGPVDSTAPHAALVSADSPYPSSESARTGQVDSTISSMIAAVTSSSTPIKTSLSLPVCEPAPLQVGERAISDSGNFQYREEERTDSMREAEQLFEFQKSEFGILLVEARDKAIAHELLAAGYSVGVLRECFQAVFTCSHQRVKSWASVRSRLAEFAATGKLGCCLPKDTARVRSASSHADSCGRSWFSELLGKAETPPSGWRQRCYAELQKLRDAEHDLDRQGYISLLLGEVHAISNCEEFVRRFVELLSE